MTDISFLLLLIMDTERFFFPTCPLAGHSMFGQNSCVELIGFLSGFSAYKFALEFNFFLPLNIRRSHSA